jgi:hypothetical protein
MPFHAVLMPCSCRAHAVLLPCRAANSLDHLTHFIYKVRPCLIHACHAAPMPRPCHCHAVLEATFISHGTARHGRGMVCVNYHRLSRDGMWATCPRSASSGYHAEFHEGCYQEHTNPLKCRTRSLYISGYQAEFHEGHGTVGNW